MISPDWAKPNTPLVVLDEYPFGIIDHDIGAESGDLRGTWNEGRYPSLGVRKNIDHPHNGECVVE
jgi:hypothetical protein